MKNNLNNEEDKLLKNDQLPQNIYKFDQFSNFSQDEFSNVNNDFNYDITETLKNSENSENSTGKPKKISKRLSSTK